MRRNAVKRLELAEVALVAILGGVCQSVFCGVANKLDSVSLRSSLCLGAFKKKKNTKYTSPLA